MRYKQLGKTGLEVSTLCLGTMAFGRWSDDEASIAILDRGIENGINFVDTANYYGRGQDTSFPHGTGTQGQKGADGAGDEGGKPYGAREERGRSFAWTHHARG